MSAYRVKIACCNWSHEDAPRALAYVVHVGSNEMLVDRFFNTWSEALSWANDMASRGARKIMTVDEALADVCRHFCAPDQHDDACLTLRVLRSNRGGA